MLNLLCCPLCRGDLSAEDAGFRCVPCGRTYPTVLGIPDFRIAPWKFFDVEADRATAAGLAAAEAGTDWEGLLREYYRLQPEAGDDLHDIHMAHLAGEADQARVAVGHIAEGRRLSPEAAVLDAGCGVGRYSAAVAEAGLRPVGVDLSLAYLVLTRKRLGGRGLVVAAEAERLPFRDAAFAGVISADVIEHVADQAGTLREMGRVLAPGGVLFLSTPNRFSLTPEPHVGLWGVGWMPHAWAVRYVWRRRRIPYADIRLLSGAGLRRMFRAVFPGRAELMVPPLSPKAMEHFPPLKRRLAGVYQTVRTWPVVRTVLGAVGPFFHVRAVKAAP
jgi:SAM-dependent methyltransferase